MDHRRRDDRDGGYVMMPLIEVEELEMEEIEMNETDKTYWRNALLSALDSVGRFDVLTPEELDAVATHLAASMSLRDEPVEKIEEAG